MHEVLALLQCFGLTGLELGGGAGRGLWWWSWSALPAGRSSCSMAPLAEAADSKRVTMLLSKSGAATATLVASSTGALWMLSSYYSRASTTQRGTGM